MQNIGFIVNCFTLVFLIIFLLVLLILREKAVMFIRTFSELPKNQRDKYNKVEIINDFKRNIIYSIIFLAISSLVSYFISSKVGIALFVIWIIVYFINNINFNRNFNKYRSE